MAKKPTTKKQASSRRTAKVVSNEPLSKRLLRPHLILICAILTAVVGATTLLATRAATPWPSAPVATICGNIGILNGGPTSAPSGAITVPAGNNSAVNFTQDNKTFWFAPGTHTLGTGQYAQIEPGSNSTYIGAPGAILDGQHSNLYAFTQHATGVTIQYLTIQNFGKAGDNNNEGVVNHDAGHDWKIQYNTVKNNAGAGVFIGSGNVVSNNCLTSNGQYGFSAYEDAGVNNVTLDHNEISYNNTDDWEAKIDGCGCTGGGKFWATKNATITNNYIHNNKSVGIWADNNNAGFLIEGNYISDNDDVGILYETSYNAMIRNNALVRNANVGGPKNPGFPTAAIYVSESGADSRVATSYNNTFDITGNLIEDNWSGVALWENADRYCGSPANTSSGECTLVNPSVVKESTCNSTNIAKAPYYNDCRWKTQNVKVHGNTFRLTPAHIGASCTFQNSCGLNAVFSNYGSYPSWSPYKGTIVQNAVTYNQNNTFSDNTYEGSWQFLPFEQGNLKSFAEWQASPYGQDAGSTLNSSTGPTPQPSADTTPPTVDITAPLKASTVAGTVNVEASASDDTTVVKVEFKIDNGQPTTDTTAPYTFSWNSTGVANGTHTITATAFDAAGNSTPTSMQVNVQNATSQPPTPAAGNGLQATYFNNADFTGSQVTRTDKTINFNWGTGSPASAIGNNTFSARWTGKIMVPATGKYTFYTRSDDGVRLWVNGQLLINNWTLHSVTENKAQVTLTAGQKYDIKMEYYENTGKAVAKLFWSSATFSKRIIPTTYLYTQ
ncbi:MAG TPA: PA14 domain-containing protein [Candidatus Saccharimonadales bacterium]|nr:PA14 domain-containing protein [Candidatus Saccharimonadales bacterium]